MMLDEISGLLGQRMVTRVATLSQITDLLKKTEQSQRVLDEASEGLTFDVLTSSEDSDENISIERLTAEEDIFADYPAGGYDDLYGAGAAGFGHSHGDVRRFG